MSTQPHVVQKLALALSWPGQAERVARTPVHILWLRLSVRELVLFLSYAWTPILLELVWVVEGEKPQMKLRSKVREGAATCALYYGVD